MHEVCLQRSCKAQNGKSKKTKADSLTIILRRLQGCQANFILEAFFPTDKRTGDGIEDESVP
jgi:hypothetical protein